MGRTSSSSRPRPRGVVVSSEVILLLGVVIIMALVALMAVGRMALTQATATKATLAVNEAQGWYYEQSGRIDRNSFITVTFYVTNLGDRQVTIGSVEVIAAYTGTTRCVYSGYSGARVNPGETVSIAMKLDRGTSCQATMLGQTVIRVSYSDADGRTNVIEAPIVLSRA